jgi:hypothetical protein
VRGPTYKGRGADNREGSEGHIEYACKTLERKKKKREIYLGDDETDPIRHLGRQRGHGRERRDKTDKQKKAKSEEGRADPTKAANTKIQNP